MGPVRLLQFAIGLLLLPVLLGVLAFVVVGLMSSGSSNPQAMGGLATAAAILSGVLIMLGLVLGAGLGLVALVWGGLTGQLPGIARWVLSFFLILGAYGAGVWVLSNGP